MKYLDIDSSDYDSQYLELINISQISMQKDINAFLSERESRMDSKNTEIMSLSHPIRMKQCGMVPLHIEMGSFNSPHTASFLLDRMSGDEVILGNVIYDLIQHDDDVKKAAIQHSNFKDGANLGSMDLSIFCHRFYATGQHYFKFTDALTKLLSESDIGKKAPCHFIRAPYSMQYIEFRELNQTVHNKVSGEHILEGMYVNQINQPADIFFVPRRGHEKAVDLSKFLIQKGYLTKDGGDTRILEIMLTGSPLGKDNVMDDATFNFKFIIQDETMLVEDAIKVHMEYYEQMDRLHMESVSDFKEMTFKKFEARELRAYREGIISTTKALLYIISSDAEKREIKEEDELKNKINRLSNKTKQRKLSKQLQQTNNYTLIGSDNYTQLSQVAGDRSVKMHWRRGHFRVQHFGEGNSETKVIWLQPMLINSGNSNAGHISAKPYKVT